MKYLNTTTLLGIGLILVFIITPNSYLDKSVQKLKVLDKEIIHGRYANHILIVQHNSGAILHKYVTPSSYYTAKVGKDVYYKVNNMEMNPSIAGNIFLFIFPLLLLCIGIISLGIGIGKVIIKDLGY